MKKNSLILFATAFSFSVKAQVVLTAAQAPVNNSIFYFYDANEPNPPFTFNKSGTVNTWDFTGVQFFQSAEDTSYVQLPSQVAGGSFFPNATHAIWEAGEKTTAFIKIDATGAYSLGVYGDVFGTGNNVALSYPGQPKVIDFPWQYGSFKAANGLIEYKLTGSQIGQPSIDSAWFKSYNENNKQVLAQGTLVVPSGSYPALLEISRNKSTDSLFVKGTATGGLWVLAPGFPKAKNDSTYYWYSNQSLQAYAHVIYKNGLVTDVNYFKSVSVSSVASVQAVETQNNFIYPNPVKSQLHVADGINAETVRIYDSNGSLAAQLQPIENVLDVSSLNPGIYVIQIYSRSGQYHTQRFIRQ